MQLLFLFDIIFELFRVKKFLSNYFRISCLQFNGMYLLINFYTILQLDNMLSSLFF